MKIVERRQASRFNVLLSAIAVTEGGHRCSIQVSNISSSGLQFSVAQAEMLMLVPNVTQENTLSPVSIQLEISLQNKPALLNDQSTLNIKCGIVYVRRKSLDQCAVGCRFEEFLENSDERLEQYLAQRGT